MTPPDDYRADTFDPPPDPVDTGSDDVAPPHEAADLSESEPADLGEEVAGNSPANIPDARPAEDLADTDAEGDATDTALIEQAGRGTEEQVEPVVFGDPTPTDVEPAAGESEPHDWQDGGAIDLVHHDHDLAGPTEQEKLPGEADLGAADDVTGAEAAPEGEERLNAMPEGEDLGDAIADTTDTKPTGVRALDTAAEPTAEAADLTEVEQAVGSEVDVLTDGALDGAKTAADPLADIACDETTPTEQMRAEYDAVVNDFLGGGEDALVDTSEISGEARTDASAPWEPASDRPEGIDLRNSPTNEALRAALSDRGLELEAVDRFDYSDNPILGYRESAPAEDIGYAVKTWNDQIAPGISAGATREDFEAYDQAHGLVGHQRLAGVYDYFLGDDAIKSGGERERGSLDVTGGRHRLEQARQQGVAYLPVRK